MDIRIQVLGSSSAGNCTVIWDDESAIMIDCGFIPDYINNNLLKLSLRLNSINGILITHTHGDHVKKSTLRAFNKVHVPVYCHLNIRKNLIDKYITMGRGHNPGLMRVLCDGENAIGSFFVRPFKVPHDSAGGCFGFNIYKRDSEGEKKITIATDMGYPTDEIIESFLDSDVIIIESNHDIEMLENSGRPQILIDRIKDIGHISNVQCAQVLKEVICRSKKKPRSIILAHMSQICNTNDTALDCTRKMLEDCGHGKIEVYPSYCSTPNEVVTL